MNLAKMLPPVGLNLEPPVIHSDVYLTELTWQMLIDDLAKMGGA